METVEDRVDTIEEIMKQLSLAQLNTEKELTRLSNSIEEGHRHTMQMFEESRRHTMQMFEESRRHTMQMFEESRRHTMQMFEESRQLTEMELQSLSQEMKEFKDEMKEFKDEMIKDRKKIDKQWGDLANKMGTVVEDIVAPNIGVICQKYFNSDPNYIMIGVKRKSVDKLKRAQFDVIAVCDDFVLLNETKTSANIEYIDKFDNFVKSGGFYDFYPEYRDIKLVPVFAAIHISEDLIDILTDRGIYSMVPSGNTMDLVNFEKVK